jgi:hypothetical protein
MSGHGALLAALLTPKSFEKEFKKQLLILCLRLYIY